MTNLPLFRVEEKKRQRWSYTVRARNESHARDLAREVGFMEPSTVVELLETPTTPFDAEAAADREDVTEFGARAYGCVMGDETEPIVDMCDPADDEARASHGR